MKSVLGRPWVVILLLMLSACQMSTATPDAQQVARRQQERTSLPAVTTIQKWQQLNVISQPENAAPSIIPLDNGDYRIFWNSPSLNGIGSGTSPDGLRFSSDAGARIINAAAGQSDCAIGNPWLIQVADGYRMFFQGQSDNCGTAVSGIKPNSRIFSATSTDGRSFTRDEGIRIDVGDSTKLTAAGHGRVIQTDDGSFRMYFTALLPDKSTTPYIMTATSADSLVWTLDSQPLLEAAHDPTALQIESTINLYVSYMTDNTLLLVSQDGVNFTPTAWLEFYDAQNQPLPQPVDLDVININDGSLVIYATSPDKTGISTFKLVTE